MHYARGMPGLAGLLDTIPALLQVDPERGQASLQAQLPHTSLTAAAMCTCLGRAVKDMLKGIGVLTALGGLVPLLLGVRALVRLGGAATNPDVAWLAYCCCFLGGLLAALGVGAATGSWCSLAAPMHCFTGASLVLQPLQALLVWAYVAHPSELRYLAERDQSYLLSSILDWVDAHRSLAGGLAAVWLTLQTAAVLLGLAHGCCAGGPPPPKHPWHRYWRGDASSEGREALLPRGSPRAEGYATPPSHFQSPYQSPGRPAITSGPLAGVPPQVVVTA